MSARRKAAAAQGRTITGTTGAWITEHSTLGPEDFKVGNHKPDALVSALCYSNGNMQSYGWTRVGSATIVLDVPSTQELVDAKVEALKAEKQKVVADAQLKANRLESQIQKLLAITYEVKA